MNKYYLFPWQTKRILYRAILGRKYKAFLYLQEMFSCSIGVQERHPWERVP